MPTFKEVGLFLLFVDGLICSLVTVHSQEDLCPTIRSKNIEKGSMAFASGKREVCAGTFV